MSVDYAARAVELEHAIIALRADPENQYLMADVASMLRPIARRWASEVSISIEDHQDAESEILAHCLEAAKPESHRRLNPKTGKPTAGYGRASGGNVDSFFYGVAQRKAFDILKGRRRAWRRECTVMQPLYNYAALVSGSAR